MLIIALTCCASVTLIMSLITCICWRKKTPKDEWQGLDGMVTQKNPDENVNHLPSAASCEDNKSTHASGESNDKRNVVTNTRRSLPDIPAEQVGVINWDPIGDNSSEHYATVGHYQNAAKRHTISNGVEQRPSISQHSSISQADDTFSPYERVKYDKIKSKEHPYAQLQPSTSRSVVVEESGSGSEERINLLRSEAAVSTSDHTDSRSRRSSAHSGGGGVGLDIPAASAVAGALAASPELPYMTPPVAQDHFSGDSQDSSKGYTSISVREPLANIMAQTKEINKKNRQLDPHYATVSDDSDDVYTTIPDPNNPIYTSESETYARIPPPPITVEVEVNAPPAQSVAHALSAPAGEVPPDALEPPSAKQPAAHQKSHSRQASSSSSIANLGSPKPEKRQANSPLPPPPSVVNFDFHAVKNLDDLYAKVHKNKNKEEAGERPDFSARSEKTTSSPESTGRSSRTSLESRTPEKKGRSAGGAGGEHDYETLKKSPKGAGDPGYEKIKGTEEEPGYASINGPPSMSSSDPGYEVLKSSGGGVATSADPNYEELRHRASNASDCSAYTKIRDLNDGYSVVDKRAGKKSGAVVGPLGCDDGSDEPNYESMPSSEAKSNGSESDPNYETVKDMEEPPYERLDEDSTRTNNSSEYEKVRKSQGVDNDNSESSSNCTAGKSSSDRTEPSYEQLDADDSEAPGYEKIRLKADDAVVAAAAPSSDSSGASAAERASDILDENGIVQV